jgi:hypothetical protein
VNAFFENIDTRNNSNLIPDKSMKTAKILGCLLLVAFSSTISRSADALPVFRVSSSPAMKVAVINGDKTNPANERLHKAFTASLGFEISMCYHTPVPVKSMEVDAQEAAQGLTNGTYDMVVVIGSDVPTILLNTDFKRLKAVPTTGNTKHNVNLLVLKDDNTLSEMLDEKFAAVLNERFFQLAFASYRKSSLGLEKTEWNVAAATVQQ